jgi:hypothetical protein
MDYYGGIWLKCHKKVVYMVYHRFSQADHPYQRNNKPFGGTIENRGAAKDLYRGTNISDDKES